MTGSGVSYTGEYSHKYRVRLCSKGYIWDAPPKQVKIAGLFTFDMRYMKMLESHGFTADSITAMSVSAFLLKVAELIDAEGSKNEDESELRLFLKHIIIYHNRSFLSLMVEEVGWEGIPFTLWLSFADDGDWDGSSVIAYRCMPTVMMERYLMEGHLDSVYSRGVILKVISTRDDEFGLPVEMLEKFW